MSDIGGRQLDMAPSRSWPPFLTHLRADALDCLQTTISLIADRCHGPGTHLALGARDGLAVFPRAGFTSLQPSVEDRLAEASELLDLRVAGRWPGVDASSLSQLMAEHPFLLVIADAYYLPWVPYAGHEHMWHSFLLAAAGKSRMLVVDAYHNDTAWGAARPGQWEVPASQLASMLTGGAEALAVTPGSPPELDAGAVLAGNAARLAAAVPLVRDYLAAATDRLVTMTDVQQLVLDIWLVQRTRKLHAAWLSAVGHDKAAAEVGARAEDWHDLATQSYVTLRRVQQGRPAGPGLVNRMATLISLDAALARELVSMVGASPPSGGTERIRRIVVDALCCTLTLDEQTISDARTLRELPGFNSFRLLDVIDQTEQRLGLEIVPSRISAASLRDVQSLCELFAAAPGGREAPWPR